MTLSIQEQIALDKALDRALEGDQGKLGDVAKMCLHAGLTQTQMNGLETLGPSARRFGELEAYVMRQTGKDRRKETWAKPLPKGKCLGAEVLEWLGSLRVSADQAYLAVVQAHPALEGERGAEAKNAFRLRLASACLRDLNSVYMYQAIQGSSSPQPSNAATSSPSDAATPKKGGRK